MHRIKQFLIRLRREPVFAAIFILTLALGVGANAALFSALHAYYLAPLPYRNPGKLVSVQEKLLGTGGISAPAYRDVMAHVHGIGSGGLARLSNPTIDTGKRPRVVSATYMTPSLLPTLGASPTVGSGFDKAAGRPGGPREVLLSHGFWLSAFGGEADAVGKTLQVNGNAYRIVGVLPAGFYFPDRSPKIYLPMVVNPGDTQLLSMSSWYFVARLQPGTTLARLNTALRAQAKREIAGFGPDEQKFARHYGYTLDASPLRGLFIGSTGKRLALIELGAAFLLALAIAILANLVTVRAIGRRHERALRLALGAGRGALWRNALSETLPLALLGGMLAIVFAWLGTSLLSHYGFGTDDSAFNVGLGGWTVVAALVLALAAGLLAALPAALGSSARLLVRLTEGEHGTPSQAARFAQRGLSILQVALGVALLVNAGLISLSFNNLSHRGLGFDAPHLVTANLGLRGPKLSNKDAQIAFVRHFADAAGQLPGVIRAGIATTIPFGQESQSSDFGKPGSPANEKAFPDVSFVTAGLLPALGIRLVAGRLFNSGDITAGAQVAVAGAPLARAVYGSNKAALGHSLQGGKETVQIVGITRPVRWFAHAPGHSDGTLWLPFSRLRSASSNVFIVVRSTLPTPVIKKELDGLLARLAPDQAFSSVRSMRAMTDEAYRGDQAPAVLFAVFALIALLLAAVGVYGTIAYLTRLRLAEFAIRQSLGASPARVHAEAIGQGIGIAIAGAVAGLAGGVLLARLLGGFTELPAAQSIPVYAVAVTVLVAVAVASAGIAARRARRTDLLSLLRPQ